MSTAKQRFKRVEELFRFACTLPAEDREAFFAQCADETSIREQARAMVRADASESGDGVLDMPAYGEGVSASNISSPHDRASAEPLPERIGHYRIIRIIGEGGMGIVYEAEQDNPRRRVAIKVLRKQSGSRQVLRRFQQEGEILGRLQHSGIAQVLEAGTTDAGNGAQPFIVMEFVHGRPLLEHAREQNLTQRERLELMALICDAVHYAHQHGVVHRDLKPGNILVTEEGTALLRHDGTNAAKGDRLLRGSPKILDFGVARLTDADVQTLTLHTTVGELIGTVPYMSPEQAAGNPANLDSRSDVYTLGVVLYELLSDRLPQDVRGMLVHEAVRAIREDDPTPIGSINRSLRGDIETIIAKALEKDKDRRYQSAADLASDIRRSLHEQPIFARPPSAMYRMRKFARRNKAIVSGIAATFFVLVAGLIGTTGMYLQAEMARAEVVAQHELAQHEAQRAIAAELQAEQRADELSRVVDFQADQLAGIDSELLGVRLRDGMIDERRRALERNHEDEQHIQRGLDELEQSIAGINFTNLAMASLEEIVFDRVLNVLHDQFADQPLVKARLLQSTASIMIELGLIERAADPQLEALAIRRRELGTQHPDTLMSINATALLLQRQGQYDEAEQAYREALSGRRNLLGAEHPDTLRSFNNLGLLLLERGQYDEAKQYLRRTMEVNLRLFGEEHPQSLTSTVNFATLLAAQGKLAEAEPYHRQVMEASRRKLGPNHARSLTAVNNLGWHLYLLGRNDEAEMYLREATTGRRRVLGDEHPATLRSINNLGVALQMQLKFDEAEQCYREALTGRLVILGDGHVDTLISYGGLGILLAQQGKLEEAASHLRRAMEGFRRELGPTHSTTLTSIGHMGRVLLLLGDLDEAEQLGAEAVQSAREALPPGHWQIGRLLLQHAQTLVAMQRYTEAEARLLEAHQILTESFGNEHVLTDRAIAALDELHQAQQLADEAAPPTATIDGH